MTYSSVLQYVLLSLGSLLDTSKFIQLVPYRTLTPRCSHSITTGRENTSLLICYYAYQRTASPSVQFYRIGHVIPFTHLVPSDSMEFYTHVFLSIRSLLPV